MSAEPIRLFAVDVGTDEVGHALLVVTPSRINLVGSGQIRADGASLGMRLFTIAGRLEDLVRASGAKLAAIESGFVQFKHRDKTGRTWSNPVANLTLAEGRGVARLSCLRGGAQEVLDVNPSQAKAAATGKGNADKWLVREMVRVQCKMTYLPGEDEGDAIAVGLAAGLRIQQPEIRELYFS